MAAADTTVANKWSCVLPPFWHDTITAYLKDDAPTFDVGGFVVGGAPLVCINVTFIHHAFHSSDKIESAVLLGKSEGVLAGVPFFDEVFHQLGCTVEWFYPEGTVLKDTPVHVAKVTGPVRRLLLGERTALNILTRASGIATAAKSVMDIARSAGWHGEVAGTRKVTPGFRLVEKYALLVGGASTHRMDLSHMVMLKDNHIWSAGGITEAVAAARSACGFSSKIEVETRSLEEARTAAAAGADVVMLDNFLPERLKIEAAALKAEFPHVMVEASGGIREETLASYTSPAVDIVSMGALTQGYDTLDFSLKIASGEVAKRVIGSGVAAV
jgi:nicotinate-nucleotide pyrophosphorylase (carboxylating)